MIDTCATFTTVELTNSRKTQSEQIQAAVALPYNPPSERYNALHVIKVADGRNFTFAVWSTGFCILELLFSDAQGRLPCGSFNGIRLKRHDGVQDDGSISVYQQFPSTQVVIFKEASFRIASLPTRTHPNVTEEATESSLVIADYVIAADAIIVLWPHGLVEKHNLSDNRIFTIAQPFESAETTATTMTSLLVEGRDAVLVGDSKGSIYVFPLVNYDASPDSLLTLKQAHTNDRPPTSDNDASRLYVWELITCFRTYSLDVSVAEYVVPEFLFCGFNCGSVECWRFPSGGKSSSKGPRLQQQPNQSISVVKRALHVIDLHMAPVLSIVTESEAGTSILANPQPDTFSWVFSYDEDAIILVWCFSLDFLFPHRRIKVHEFIKGIYVFPAEGCLDLFAYIDRCIDRVDHLCSGDIDAVRLRLLRGRELSAQRLKNQESSNQATKSEWRRVSAVTGLRASTFTPTNAYNRSRLLVGAPSVQINIALPEVEHKVNPLRKLSTEASPEKHLFEESKPSTPLNAKQPQVNDTQAEGNSLHSILSSSPTLIVDRPISKPRTSPTSRGSPRRNNHSRSKAIAENTIRDTESIYRPGENSLPSSFQQTRPRVYRNAVNLLNSLSSQARCAVVTAGDSCVSPSHLASANEDDLEMSGTLSVARNLVRPTSPITCDVGVQEKVSVVSLVEDIDDSILLLDYQAGSRRSRKRPSRKQVDEEIHQTSKATFHLKNV
ncbi:Hypothetical protein PHPALM_15132 [Phytophthora palmivora]|uniref:Uncharacterized protein n=1 Tax=Phytophthora palmivora TaxID=4796 RepID=A0A2P4XT37_9STRA|nr:Hypothetical protein PHPALM_15132 [Phytophthora palmivora]